MSILEPITHREEIQSLLDEAQQWYDKATKNFDDQKQTTTKKLENLGKTKIYAWADGMDTFVDVFSSFKNIEIDRTIDTNLHFIGSDEEPKQMLMNIQNASMTANEIAKAGVAAVGTGVLVGIASYGGAMMFASASTGTAIATLSGAAKTNATLAWFGGGSLKSGGLGMSGGKLVLAGIVVAPILIVGALISGAKGKEKLAEAKKINAEAKDAAAKIEIMTMGMSAIAKMSDNYSSFIKKLNREFKPFIRELDRIRIEHISAEGEKIDFNSLNAVEQKTLHISWLMAQIYYHVLSATILTDSGELSLEASQTLSASTKELRMIRKDTFKMTGEDAQIGDLMWNSTARKMMLINLAAAILFATVGIGILSKSTVSGICCLISAVVAFPVFFRFRDLSASKVYFWCLVRLIIAIIFVFVIVILA